MSDAERELDQCEDAIVPRLIAERDAAIAERDALAAALRAIIRSKASTFIRAIAEDALGGLADNQQNTP